MSFTQTNGSIRNDSPYPDNYYEYQPTGQPYPSLAAVTDAAFPSHYRLPGKKVKVQEGTNVIEYILDMNLNWVRGNGAALTKATSLEAVAGNDNEKYITPRAIKDVITALVSSGVLNGKSAYQLWRDLGYTGTQAEYQLWLKGDGGSNAGFRGQAIASTNPGTPGMQVWYFAAVAGTYVNFVDAGGNAITVGANEGLVVLSYNGSAWQKASLPVQISGTPTNIPTGGKNLFDYQQVVDGYYITGQGVTAYGGAQVSGKIAVLPSKPYIVSGFGTVHYPIDIGWFDSSDTFLSNVGLVAENIATGVRVDSPVNAAFARFTTLTTKPGENTNVQNIQFEQSAVATAFEAFNALLRKELEDFFVKTLYDTKSYGTISDPNHVINKEYIDNLLGTPVTVAVAGKNLYDASQDIANFYVDGAGNIAGFGGASVSAMIPILPNREIISSGWGASHYAIRANIYNSSQVRIATVDFAGEDQVTAIVNTTPADAAFLQFTTKTTKAGENNANIQLEYGNVATSYEAYGAEQVNVFGSAVKKLVDAKAYGDMSHPQSVVSKSYVDRLPPLTAGKRAIIFGDSITDPSWNNGSNWPDYANPYLNLNITNYAKDGATYIDRAENTTGPNPAPRRNLSKQVTDAIAAGIVPDIVVIALGRNDITYGGAVGAGLGDYNTAIGKPIDQLDRTKGLEAMRWAYYKIRNEWPSVQLFVASPLQIAAHDPTDFDTYYEALRKMSGRYGAIFCNATYEVDIIRDFENYQQDGRDLYDGLHPKTSGKIKQGKYMAAKILAHYKPSI